MYTHGVEWVATQGSEGKSPFVHDLRPLSRRHYQRSVLAAQSADADVDGTARRRRIQ